jgi:diketogulonate reductase-like aldo/keto reductase
VQVDTAEAWANEDYVGESIEQGSLMNAKALGGVAMAKQIINYITGEE